MQADGIPQYRHTSILLDLSQGAYLMKYMDTNITETPVLPYRMERLYVYGSNRATVTVTGKWYLMMIWIGNFHLCTLFKEVCILKFAYSLQVTNKLAFYCT